MKLEAVPLAGVEALRELLRRLIYIRAAAESEQGLLFRTYKAVKHMRDISEALSKMRNKKLSSCSGDATCQRDGKVQVTILHPTHIKSSMVACLLAQPKI